MNKGVNLSQKVQGGGGADSKYEIFGSMLPKNVLNFGPLEQHFQRFRGAPKVIVKCALTQVHFYPWKKCELEFFLIKR